MSSPNNFRLKTKAEKKQLLKKISAHYDIVEEKPEKQKLSFFDTFDWRLFNNNLALVSDNQKLILRSIDNPKGLFTTLLIKFPAFIGDFPEGDFKAKVKKILQMRALVLKGSLEFELEQYRLLDKNSKTVLRLSFESFSSDWKNVNVSPVRGYQNHLKKLLNIIDLPAEQKTNEDLFLQAMKLSGQKPGDYSSKIQVKLTPNMQSGKAMQLIYIDLLKTMVANEQGLKDDVDTEFLHDYRVSIRRTRSALSLVKGVLPVREVQNYLKKFTELGKTTNKLRDIDVYRLSKPEFEKKLPEKMQKGFQPFFIQLGKERKVELTKVRRKINSAAYKEFKQQWNDFINLNIKKSDDAPLAEEQIIIVAKKYIKKRYARILNDGKAITEASPDERLHELRIQCKKLRYLLEFFSSLFPQKIIVELINNLKDLQDNLGKFNDLFVQQEYLKNFVETHKITTETVLAIGYLVGKLNEEQLLVRTEFQNRFNRFAGIESQNKFKELLNNSGEK